MKIFNTKEDANRYYKYILVNIARKPYYIEYFHTEKQAEKSEMFYSDYSFSLTRKQFEKFRAQNKEMFE